MISIGIDPSINSTGLTVFRFTGKTYSVLDYYVIGHKPTKKTLECYKENSIRFIEYGKNTDKKILYSDNESIKTENLIKSSAELRKILEKVKTSYGPPDVITMEGISYGSTSGSSLADLAGLNFLYRYTIVDTCPTAKLIIASPMEVKKFAVGNGGVDKETMIYTWQKCEPVMLIDNAKVDDVADSYFMALYGMVEVCPEFESFLVLPEIDLKLFSKSKKSNKRSVETPEEVLNNFEQIPTF